LSEGQRLLLLAPELAHAIGTSIGVTKQVVSLWRRGERVPNLMLRLRLQATLGIPADAWIHAPSELPLQAPPTGRTVDLDPGVSCAAVAAQPNGGESPGSTTPAPRAGSFAAALASGNVSRSPPRPVAPAPPAPPAPPAAPAAPAAAPRVPTTANGTPTTMQGVETLLRTIREHRAKPGLLASEQVRLADAETRLLSLRHRLEKEVELVEGRIIRDHPMWQQIKVVLATTLLRWPDAARAVAAALREIEK